MSDRYILDEHGEPQRCDDLLTWGRWFDETDPRVFQDMDEGEGADRVLVSTVFLGLDHNFFSGGPPVLWETMVFGGPLAGEMLRYSSLADAWRGHQAMCQRVRETLP